MINVSPHSRGGRGHWRRWLPLVILIAAIIAVWASGVTRYLTLASIAAHRDGLKAMVGSHYLVALGGYMLVYVACIALSMPGGALLTILGGFLFGWLVGGVATVIAATAGATIIFLIAKSSFGAFLAEKAGSRAKTFAEGFRRDAFNYMLFLRLVPLFPFWLVNIAPALFNVSSRTYVVSTFIGIIPATFAFSMLGASLDSIIMAQKAAFQACVAAHGHDQCRFALDPGALITPQLVAAFAALGVIAIVPVIWKRYKAHRTGNSAASGAGRQG